MTVREVSGEAISAHLLGLDAEIANIMILHKIMCRKMYNIIHDETDQGGVMPTCIPIKDMRDTAAFSELVESSATPVVVTKNGYDRFVVMRSADYDALVAESSKARLMARIALAEKERASGQHKDAASVVSEIRGRYGL